MAGSPETLFPVILSVPLVMRLVRGREKVRFLSEHARKALARSARLSRVRLVDLPKDPEGVPLPENGIYWSISHKPLYVGGVASREPVGIDIEQVRPVRSGLYEKTASDQEWQLGKDIESTTLFFRYWTAKEAVIKTAGTGIRDLRNCRVDAVDGTQSLYLSLEDTRYRVEHHYFDDHMASIVRQDKPVEWMVASLDNEIESEE